ncbi:MAG: GNAT family N-acetyltransferase [Planctomycetota bacterium]|jgi:RimJ/RimL family protein N-acetyltransferase
MAAPDTLETQRLILRRFTLDDAPEVAKLAGAREIASTTVNIPHPYDVEAARNWLSPQPKKHIDGELANFAIVLRVGERLAGSIGLVIDPPSERAELGYWIGTPYWGNGYVTEAAHEVVRHGFEDLGLNRIVAHHFRRNPASGRVLQKVGMNREGLFPQHVKKWDQFEDLVFYGLLRADYRNPSGRPGVT